MCGIAGFVDYERWPENADQIAAAMSRTLESRGPDEGGVYKHTHAYLIHRRLSVVDPDHGKQPMRLADGEWGITLAYNGELYNTQELKKELLDLGHRFSERSDTEVLLHAYAEWGADCLKRLNGIYAFAVWDEKKQSLFLARDRMGVKPLFFFRTENGLLFASQLKTLLEHPAVKPEVDEDGLRELFFVGPGRSGGCGVFKGVEELKPAQCALLDRDGLKVWEYWSLNAREHTDNLAETIAKTRWLIADAIQRQLVSDVPLCCFLSGGLDSSIISKVASDQYRERGETLSTYSVDYQDNDRYFKKSMFQPDSDNRYIDIMAEYISSSHTRVTLDNISLARALPAAAAARDLPGMADIDSSLLLFCREIKKNFTVGVSGECADEVFGGYPWYHSREILFEDCFPWSRSLDARHKILRPGVLAGGDEYVREKYLATVRSTDSLPTDSPLQKRMREMSMLNLRWFMQTLLDRKDRMSMAAGLEVRVPFCDHRIVEYAYNMPWEFKALYGREKGIVRAAVSDLLPEKIVWRKKSPYPKTHNPIFLAEVLKMVRQIQANPDSVVSQFIDWTGVEEMVEHPDELTSPWYGQLMRVPQILAYIVQLDAWFQTFHVSVV
ncbi:MAG: asparagine synthase (glutamine-hydrolyzing) [Oscillospiraceae bacterium]|nr:asparagine synthase (glutamine-hydrolyzing) [Oscillospiraceae bacterium]